MRNSKISLLFAALTLTSALAPAMAAPARKAEAAAATSAPGHHAKVNGLDIYYEVHGSGRPLVLLHGALSTASNAFGEIVPVLARTRQVIVIEQQGHGRTADRPGKPLSYRQMADDTVALLQQLAVEKADFFGFSMGCGVALEIATRYPERVNKLVLAALAFERDGLQPGLLDQIAKMKVTDLDGTPWRAEFLRVGGTTKGWATLIGKIKQLNKEFRGWTAAQVQAIKAPTLIVIGDADIVRPEHAVQMFRLLGGGAAGDDASGRPTVPTTQLAILPGTTHVSLLSRADLLLPMLTPFLNPPAAAQ